MARNTGCGGSCSCSFRSGLNVTVPGYGSGREPFRVTVAALSLQAVSTVTARVTLNGTGSVDSPYMLSIMAVEADGKWKNWRGSQEEYNTLKAKNDTKTLHVVIPE